MLGTLLAVVAMAAVVALAVQTRGAAARGEQAHRALVERVAALEAERAVLADHVDRLWHAHVQSALGVGPFAPLFAPSVAGPSAALSLLHGVEPSLAQRIRRVQGADARAGVLAMLAQPAWDQHLVAAVWVCSAEIDDTVRDALWRRIEAGSWVSPQLLVAARRVDPSFAERVDGLVLEPTARNAAAELLGRPDRDPADPDGGDGIARAWNAAVERAIPSASAPPG